MAATMVLAHSDRYVGLVQATSLVVAGAAIALLAVRLGLTRRGAAFGARVADAPRRGGSGSDSAERSRRRRTDRRRHCARAHALEGGAHPCRRGDGARLRCAADGRARRPARGPGRLRRVASAPGDRRVRGRGGARLVLVRALPDPDRRGRRWGRGVAEPGGGSASARSSLVQRASPSPSSTHRGLPGPIGGSFPSRGHARPAGPRTPAAPAARRSDRDGWHARRGRAPARLVAVFQADASSLRRRRAALVAVAAPAIFVGIFAVAVIDDGFANDSSSSPSPSQPRRSARCCGGGRSRGRRPCWPV